MRAQHDVYRVERQKAAHVAAQTVLAYPATHRGDGELYVPIMRADR